MSLSSSPTNNNDHHSIGISSNNNNNTTTTEASPTSSSKNRRHSSEPQSWGELLNNYISDRVSAHPQVEKPDPIYRQTRDRSLKWREEQRQINPVLQQFIEPKREEAFTKIEHEHSIDMMNRAMDRSNLLETHFDIVTLKDKTKVNVTNHQQHLGKKIDYNNILKYSDSVELIDRESKRKKFQKPKKSFDDFYLIYKTQNPLQDLKQELNARDEYIKTRYDQLVTSKRFHPILQLHHDPNIEQREREKEEHLLKETIKMKLSKEPPTVQRLSENKAFNIITKEVKDSKRTQQLEHLNQVQVERRPIAKVKYDYESTIKTRDAQMDELNDRRALNTKSSVRGGRERMGQTQHDIVSGEDKKLPPPPSTLSREMIPIAKHMEKEEQQLCKLMMKQSGGGGGGGNSSTTTSTKTIVNSDQKGLKIKLR